MGGFTDAVFQATMPLPFPEITVRSDDRRLEKGEAREGREPLLSLNTDLVF